MTIRPYAPQDRQKLCDLFAELIENHKEYISHGELQMGIATDRGELAPDFRNAWLRYLDRQTADPETEIMLAEQDGTPTGFVIYGINRDGAAPSYPGTGPGVRAACWCERPSTRSAKRESPTAISNRE